MTDAPRPPDIEIYIAATPGAEALAWLAARFPDHEPPHPAGKRQWRQQLRNAGTSIPVLVIEGASPGFTSIWFDNSATPWESDLACAREAFAHFGREIRVTAGSWTEEADPDSWWSISSDGEKLIQWPG